MLRGRALEEEEVQRLWTYKSLLVSRLTLWVFYTGFLVLLVGAFSLGVLQHALEQLGEPRPSEIEKPD
jgi:hypothetical protein